MIQSIHIVSVIFVIYIQPNSALTCYKCSADSDAGCDAKQIIEHCEGSKDACVVIRHSYYKTLQNGSRVVKDMVTKRCITSVFGDCSLYCKHVIAAGTFNCKQHCCSDRDLCNSDHVVYTSSRISSSTREKSIAYLPFCLMIFYLLYIRFLATKS